MALGTVLPTWPALVFTYLEPVALIMGWHSATFDPQSFVLKQVPTTTPSSLTPVSASALCLSYAAGNVYLLLGLIAILCTAITHEARVAKYYLFFVALGDLGHIYASYRAMGPEIFWDFSGYNDMMWGNIGGSAFLHVNRLATILGVFGRLGPRA
ncbi:uncharacterized protein BDR25DRAFT_282292 [Lindgomyces ingoldianus]|uniref:Uncharacterized protein n=1 Tax=Lindgomyces ingoldianus TaxID=673940 RepID=A0ACB6R1Z2_9PLEO|nr:uncharacterized protein BDR25DRAFT_282292 [Lindgomyces ingoldianus]KAF2473072.1 hypothetical protein BDR25DRAFT_282292 [Lindgomyces ingoldianus]